MIQKLRQSNQFSKEKMPETAADLPISNGTPGLQVWERLASMDQEICQRQNNTAMIALCEFFLTCRIHASMTYVLEQHFFVLNPRCSALGFKIRSALLLCHQLASTGRHLAGACSGLQLSVRAPQREALATHRQDSLGRCPGSFHTASDAGGGVAAVACGAGGSIDREERSADVGVLRQWPLHQTRQESGQECPPALMRLRGAAWSVRLTVNSWCCFPWLTAAPGVPMKDH